MPDGPLRRSTKVIRGCTDEDTRVSSSKGRPTTESDGRAFGGEKETPVNCADSGDAFSEAKNHSTQDSHVVPHHGTNWAALRLTAQIGRDAVLSESYGRGCWSLVPQPMSPPCPRGNSGSPISSPALKRRGASKGKGGIVRAMVSPNRQSNIVAPRKTTRGGTAGLRI
jgi:hypothetical protein